MCCFSNFMLLRHDATRRLVTTLVIGLSATSFGIALTSAHDGHDDKPKAAASKKPDPVDEKTLHRPSRMPDRIVLTWTDEPTNSQAVSWRTDSTVTQAVAQIAVAEPGAEFEKKAKSYDATTQKLTTDLHSFHCHSVTFRELAPATKYVYRVGDGVNWSEWFQFRTASLQAEPFSFIYFGDAQNSLRSLWSRVIREASRDAPKASFFLHAGDLVNNSKRDAEWGEWFQAGGWLNAMIPSVPAPGNHEYQSEKVTNKDGKEETIRSVCAHWRAQFALPTNGPPGLDETAYRIDYQGLRLLVLNSNEPPERQTPWIEHQLKDNPQTWTVIAFHHPLYSAAVKRDNGALRKAWKPLFDRYRVDLVLQGHDHAYARSQQLPAGMLDVTEPETNVPSGAAARSDEGGTIYVVSVSGPKMYGAQRQPFMRRVAEDTQLYQIVHIDGGTLRFESRMATGELYDAFTLKKQPGRVNEVIEQVPATPPRLRPPQPAPPEQPAKP